jgi:hypothetical protein
VTGAKLVAMLEGGEGLVGMLVVSTVEEAVEKAGEALVISGRSSVVGIAVLVPTGGLVVKGLVVVVETEMTGAEVRTVFRRGR